eukprot:UN10041
MQHHSSKTFGPDSEWAPLIKEHQCVYDDVKAAVDKFFVDIPDAVDSSLTTKEDNNNASEKK